MTANSITNQEVFRKLKGSSGSYILFPKSKLSLSQKEAEKIIVTASDIPTDSNHYTDDAFLVSSDKNQKFRTILGGKSGVFSLLGVNRLNFNLQPPKGLLQG